MDRDRFSELVRDTQCMDSSQIFRQINARLQRLRNAEHIEETRLIAQDLDWLCIHFKSAVIAETDLGYVPPARPRQIPEAATH